MKNKNITLGASLRRRVNSSLDTVAKRQITFFGWTWDSYLTWIYSGVAIGTAVLFWLSLAASLSISIIAVIVFMVAALSLALFKGAKRPGRSHPFLNWARKGVYHFQIVALFFTVTFLWFVQEPIFVYLDVLVVGMLIYQSFGRIGCFMAGCCHGRPHRWGVRYGRRHAETGYAFFERGVRLFPIQLVEAAWLFLLAVGAISIQLHDNPPAENLTWYVVGYGAGRFLFEFLRGDKGHYLLRGFSEAQWTAVLLTAIVVGLELASVVPFHQWHVVVLALMMSTMAVRVFRERRLPAAKSTLDPPHEKVRELSDALDSILIEANLLPVKASGDGDPQGPYHGIYLPKRRLSTPDGPPSATA